MKLPDYDEQEPNENKPYILIRRNYRKEFYFILKAPNGRTLCSSEGYQRLAGCLKGANALKKYSPLAPIELSKELKDANFTLD